MKTLRAFLCLFIAVGIGFWILLELTYWPYMNIEEGFLQKLGIGAGGLIAVFIISFAVSFLSGFKPTARFFAYCQQAIAILHTKIN